MKIELQRRKEKPHWFTGGVKQSQLTHALPFFTSPARIYTHRVRSGTVYRDRETGEFKHIALQFWCGGGGFLSDKKGVKYGSLMAECPENSVMCATCEGRAIGAGMTETRMINGKFSLFQPRI